MGHQPQPNVAVAGFFHETNTFLKGRTGHDDFEIFEGEQLLGQRNRRHPVAGFLDRAVAFGWRVVPAGYYRARPSGLVSDKAVDAFWRSLEGSMAGKVDAVLLALHGAMVAESHEDVEGEILSRLRELVGADMPVFGVIDLHANFTPRMARNANCLLAYRKNPHTDAYETACRAGALLQDSLMSGRLPRMDYRHSRRLYPAIATDTMDEPMKSLESAARSLEKDFGEALLAVNIQAGFAHADTLETGLSFSLVHQSLGPDQRNAVFQQLQMTVNSVPSALEKELPVASALKRIEDSEEHPVILVESADNVGGGAPGDGTMLLKALLDAGVEGVVAVLNDPQAVNAFRDRSAGERRTMEIGGASGELGAYPLQVDAELVSQSDGTFQLEDTASHLASSVGTHIEMGPCAVIRVQGVTILLTSRATPPFDLGQLRSQGINPEAARVIVVKAAVAYRRAYGKISACHYFVDTEGPCSNHLDRLPYARLRRPIWPLDKS